MSGRMSENEWKKEGKMSEMRGILFCDTERGEKRE